MTKLVLIDSDFCQLRNTENQQGKTPLGLAQGKYQDILITIWDRVRQGNILKIREYALSADCPYGINSQTHYFMLTPLHVALATQSFLVIKTILDLGGDPMAMDVEGESAIGLAKKLKCSHSLIEKLEEKARQLMQKRAD